MKGLLITLEGIDGSGKTTASKVLAGRLTDALPNRTFVFTSEPTCGKAGDILRSINLRGIPSSGEEEGIAKARKIEELLLFMADHADHLASKVIPALNGGAIVISDRYADSTAAYQGATLRGIVQNPVQWIRELYSSWNILPDMTILFELDPALALQRIRSRLGADKWPEKFENEVFLREVDANFRLLARLEMSRFVLIDASRPIEETAGDALSRIIEFVSRRS